METIEKMDFRKGALAKDLIHELFSEADRHVLTRRVIKAAATRFVQGRITWMNDRQRIDVQVFPSTLAQSFESDEKRRLNELHGRMRKETSSEELDRLADEQLQVIGQALFRLVRDAGGKFAFRSTIAARCFEPGFLDRHV